MVRRTDKMIDPEDLISFIDYKGAVTLMEVKDEFRTNSNSARLSLYSLGLYLADEDSEAAYNLISVGGSGMTVYWMLNPAGPEGKGRPNPLGLRRAAEARHRKQAEARQQKVKPASRRGARRAVVTFDD